MGDKTKISWADDTFNGWWGCERVSPACLHCYAEAFAKRTGNDVWGKNSERRFFGDKHWAEPLRWNAKAAESGEPRRVFCSSMADVFEDRRDLDEHRARLWDLIEATPALTWMLLTKRPEQMGVLAPERWAAGWPANVWAGTTVEDRRRAEERIPVLAAVPARVRFLSCEPLLGPVDLAEWIEWISWVLVGGESGGKARRMDPDWAETLMGQAVTAGVAAHFKQAGRVLGREWGCPDSHCGDDAWFPEWARRREFPA